MVKIGRWAQPYSEPGNPYPDETNSLNSLPLSCPINILPYGLLTEVIIPLIKVKRREERGKRIDFLIKKTLKVNLVLCFEEIFRLSRLYPKDSLIPKLRNTYELHNKQSMRQLVTDCEIPTIYLEEMYQKQLQGPPKLEVGDWVKFYHGGGRGWRGRGDTWGVIQRIIGKNDVEISLVKKRFCKSTNYQGQPLFHRWERGYGQQIVKQKISMWKCEKVGHDTMEWKKLRSKLINDYNENCRKRNDIWVTKLVPLIRQTGGDLQDVERLKRIWFTMRVNFLDKDVWESIKDNLKDNSYLVRTHLYWCFDYDMWGEEILEGNFNRLKGLVLENGILD